MTWRIPLIGYEEYATADEKPTLIYTMDKCLYSPSAAWGLYCGDDEGILAGTREVVEEFKSRYLHWYGDCQEFINGMREASLRRGVDFSWVQDLLNDLHGNETPTFAVDDPL